MFRRVVEYIGPNDSKSVRPNGLQTYTFTPRDEILGVAAEGRKVDVVEDEKAFDNLMAPQMGGLFQVAEEIEQRVKAREMLIAFGEPAVQEALVDFLEGLGFSRTKRTVKRATKKDKDE